MYNIRRTISGTRNLTVPGEELKRASIALKKLAKKFVISAAAHSGLLRVFDQLNARRNRVLTYHGLTGGNSAPLTLTDVSEQNFEEHIEFLHRRYRILPLRELRGQPNAIALTFDDGNLSDLRRAAPILNQRKIAATFFVCSDLMLGKRRWTWPDEAWLIGYAVGAQAPNQTARLDEASRFALGVESEIRRRRLSDPYVEVTRSRLSRAITEEQVQAAAAVDPIRFTPMNTSEVRELAACGHEIACHTASHPILSHIVGDPVECRRELSDCRADLRRSIGLEIDALGYPFGGDEDVAPEVIDFAKSAGYQRAYYNVWTRSDDPLRGGRLHVSASGLNDLCSVTSGFVNFIQQRRLL